MTPGIRIAHLTAFASCALLVACADSPDPAQLTAVDQLISATDGAVLALNELDPDRYVRSDSLFATQLAGFNARFADTLARDAARGLGNQYLSLRASAAMGRDHDRVREELAAASERLRDLRPRLAKGGMRRADGATAIAAEQQLHTALIQSVHAVMDNYRLLQHAWDRRDSVSSWLAGGREMGLP